MLSKKDAVIGAQIRFKPSCWFAQRTGRQGGDVMVPGGFEVTGTVDYVNRRNNIYSITLKEGVHASVRAQDVQGGIPLYPNDRVSVFITSVRDDYVTGIAMKI